MRHRRWWRAPALQSTIRRLFWGALLGMHVPILGRTALGGFDDGISAPWLGEFALLAASVALFALKLIDVPLLRLPSSRSAAIAFVLITAIVHHDAVATTDSHVPMTAAAVALAPIAGIELWRHRRSLFRSATHLLQLRSSPLRELLPALYDDRTGVLGRSWRDICNCHAPSRAPPTYALNTLQSDCINCSA